MKSVERYVSSAVAEKSSFILTTWKIILRQTTMITRSPSGKTALILSKVLQEDTEILLSQYLCNTILRTKIFWGRYMAEAQLKLDRNRSSPLSRSTGTWELLEQPVQII